MIKADKICFSYDKEKPILTDVSFEAMSGECFAILGNNGAGKSTLLKCINKLLPAGSGHVEVNGKDISKLGRKELASLVAYVKQRNETYRMTVFDTVLQGRMPYIKFAPTQDDYRETRLAIEELGLEEKELSFLDELSGGELQKVMIARALAQKPRVLLMDEPTNNLDLKNQHRLMKLISELAKKQGILIMIVMHDLNLALKYCDKIMLMNRGKIYACGGPEIITEKAIKDVYEVDARLVKAEDEYFVVVK